MFGINDIPKFLLAFFLVLPVISIVHEAGHVLFAWLMGAKNIRVVVGSGKPVFTKGIIEIRQYYFWYGFCTFENIERKEKLANILIFSGGALFNLLSTIAVILLVENKFLETGMITYQFTYFSMYYVFFALLPMIYPGGNYSDGKMILELVKNKEEVIRERTYRVQKESNGGSWQVLDHKNKLVQTFQKEEDAVQKAREIAQEHHPSRIVRINGDEEKEIQNYPRIPL
ncbi:site-2 protease family protein [Salinimicrobium sp. TH3]|uniref:site-2 protease family protein n=1 Tax=Salinimicrobium sp. TH3 TaxID=2997342 RepID=UPI002272D483|nr:site-2 protease family protein [Salinimicrobium sp. TH3]MCY2687177.1 site-2 protease family protein [Salinimicrobium sp. TH3]